MTRRKTEPYGIKSLYIDRFRNMRNIDLPLGQRITVIAGQNGTGKSTILGMLGQPFGMVNAKTIFGKSCLAKFTDIFKFSPDHDVPGEHIYFVDFNDESISHGKQHVQVKSFKRTGAKSHIRMVTGATRAKGEGNIDYPVIYLGLRRAFPVGEIASPVSQNAALDQKETESFCEWYSRVIVPTSGSTMEPVRMSKGRKDTLLLNTDSYDFLANSAGQDNLGQILGAIISFQRIKAGMGLEYKGGVLLIDELDATLFPASQVGLFDILYDIAPELKLQIVFTTHSIHLIDHALDLARKGDDVSVTYLKSRSSGIVAETNPLMDSIRSDLFIKPIPRKTAIKVEIWCEDEETKWFLGRMLPTRTKEKCDIRPVGLSCGELGALAIRTAPAIENVIFIVDGDSDKSATSRERECGRRFVIPGGDVSPEESINRMLASLEDDDPFWGSCKRGYSKQIYIKNRQDKKRAWESTGGKKKRSFNRDWFRSEKRSGVWGPNGSAVYAAWSERFSKEISEFIESFERRVDAVARRMEFERKNLQPIGERDSGT